MRRIEVSKEGSIFTVDEPDVPGTPPVGRGWSMDAALGDWLRNNQRDLGIQIDVADSAMPAEEDRRESELAKR